ncbi:MAG: DEAD/DEAH box helicase [Saprospiraceae bacterium]|nr:DEAD/DEAH box helicase [Saprospiraceae bacterium]
MLFTDLNLNKSLINALNDLEIYEPTTIQAKSFSTIMSGKDVVGISQTGTGKTFAFLLPLLKLWKFTKSPNPQILIVVPTRELVAQVVDAVNNLTKYMTVQTVGVYGGTNMRTQLIAVEAGLDILVGTPGRLVDIIRTGSLKTKNLKRIVIDEVDEMLNLGFRTQLRNLIDFLPKKRQHLMFSATMTEDVELVINEFTNYYTKIEAAPSGAPLENISQIGYLIPNFKSKVNLLVKLLEVDETMNKVLVFAKTKKLAEALYETLASDFPDKFGIIHSSKSQNNRFNTVESFQNGSIKCLIATDIIARGLDVSSVTHVINFDLPDNAEKYIHRIGRTGRSENKGVAISFISEEDKQYQEAIEDLMNLKISIHDLPENVEITDELISLEKSTVHLPFTNKVKIAEPTGPAFHEKLAKNKKVNNKIRHEELMKIKYGKPKSRGKKR